MAVSREALIAELRGLVEGDKHPTTGMPMLPRPVFVALRRLGSSTDAKGVFVGYPSKGLLRAQKMGLAEPFEEDPVSKGVFAWRRTAEGDKYFPTESLTQEAPSLLTLERNDVAGAMAVARALKAAGRLDSGTLEVLVRLQDDPTELEAALGAELTP